ncbi:MAG TPA: anaerobic ribonucleoside-triphosphate reductase, partial [Candidatus Pacearchaeota archaeon]|nr:anaerobic ribonucleoside-triphosphate reductase [Candidatus Pacearchaeota archaeon]
PKCVVKRPCEVYSRIVGYIRPVNQWNEGKQQEFKERKVYSVPQTHVKEQQKVIS